MTLADSVGAVCAFLNLPPGAGTSTIESKTNFLRAVTSGWVEAIARPRPGPDAARRAGGESPPGAPRGEC